MVFIVAIVLKTCRAYSAQDIRITATPERARRAESFITTGNEMGLAL